mmetsp:Transcript_20621/g.43714  ORF Transcript_20621/g.43714 Transcript_20621/m.43714 type:complete len:752 (-) Transcript_20621:486-2741(-)
MVSIVTATRSCSGLLGTTSSRNYNYKSSTSSIAPIRRRHRLGLSCCCAHNSLLHCLLIISISIAMFVSIAAPARCFCSALTTSSRIVTHSSTTTRSASYSYSSAAFLLRHGGSAAQPVRVLGNLASSRCYSSSSNNRDDSSTSNARRREQDRRNEGRNGSRRSPSSSSSRDRNSPVDRSPVDRSRRRRREIQPREYSSNYNSEYDYTASDNYDDNNTARRRITTTRYDDYDYGNNNNGRNRNNDGYITNNRNNNAGNNPQEKGRNRYSSDGRKKERSLRGRESGRGGRGRGRGRGNSNNNNSSSSRYNQQQRRGSYSESESLERPPTPPLTSRPTYFTCRHTYESALRQELQRSIAAHADAQAAPGFNNDYVDYSKLVSFSKPHPGLVLISTDDKDSIGIASLLSTLRPTYALQVLSNCVVVQAESIKGLAKAILASPVLSQQQDAGLLRNELIAAPRGSLAVHALVPEMGRGMPESNLPQYRRATKVAEEVAAQLQKRCKAARSVNANDTNNEHDTTKTEQEQEKWLLQIMLLEPQIVAASFSKCISSGSNSGSSSSSSSAKVNGIIGEERVDTETEKVKNQGDDDDDDREEEDSVDNDDRKEEYYDDDDERIEEHNYQGDDKEISFQEYDVVFAVDGSLLANCHTTGNQLFRKLVESSTGIHNNAPPTPQRRSRRNRSVDPTQKALVDNNLKEFYDAVSDNDGRFLRQHFNARDGTHSESYREMIDNEALNVISVSIAVGSCDEPIALG